MKTKRTSSIAITHCVQPRVRTLASYLCFGVLFSILVASALYTVSSASSSNKATNAPSSAGAVIRNDDVKARSRSFATRWFAPVAPLAPFTLDTLATYEVVGGLCTNTSKNTFNLGESVCVKASADLSGRRLSIDGTDGTVADLIDVTTDPQELIFTLPNSTTSVVNGLVVDNRGLWRATVRSSADFGSRATAFFSVNDPANAAADLIIFSDSTATDTVTPGSPTGFSVYLRNDGPDEAAAVHVTQNVPANMTFNSATAGSGTAFTCSEDSGVVDCIPAGNLPSGATSAFTINYDVSAGAPTAILTSEIDITSTTTDPHPTSNISLARVEIRAPGDTSATCALACPLNRTVAANTMQSGQPGALVDFAGDIESSGDCGTVTSSPASGSFFSVTGSPHTVTVNSTTGGGSCSFTITVTQVAAPTISCAADQSGTASGSSSEASVTVNAPTATGTNVQVSGVRNDNRSLSDGYPIGTTTITWTATECNNPPDCDDPNARFASCTQRIIVTSADAPTITCPTNRTFAAAAGECEKTVLAEDIGLPSAGGTNVTVTNERSDGLNLTAPYPAGDTFITWTATNAIGSASCTQKIHINAIDIQPPTLTVPPDVSATTSTCSALLDDELGVATATDNCTSSVNITRTGVPLTACTPPNVCPIPCPTAGNPGRTCVENFIFQAGTTDVTYTATDAAGNQTTGVQHVTVHESTPPTITAPPNVTANTGPGATSCGTVVGDATLGTATVVDNCDVTVIRTGVPAGNIFPVGQTTITYTAKADLGVTATQVVTIVDNTPPVVTAPGAVTLYTGSGATSCGVTVSNLDATLGTGSATDNCPGVGGVSRSGVPAGNVFPVGQTTVTYSATDAHGNTSSADQVVTVVDNTPPVVTAPGAVTLYTGSGATSCGVTVSNLDATLGTGSATDNCSGVGGVSRSGVPAGNIFPVGQTTVTYSATDAHGNTSSANQVVTVVDNTPPAITCQADIIADFDSAVNGAVVTYTAPVGTDNCASTTTQIAGLPSGSTFPTGTTTNTFRVTDASGNTAQCSFKVTVALTSLIGLDSVTITGAGYADSYSSAGGYPATKGSLANILSNGTITMGNSAKVWGNVRSTRAGVALTGASQITGNATAGTTVTTSGSATVLGTRTNNALAPVMTLPSVPACSPFSSNSGISGTYSYNASTGDLTLSGVNIATLANGNYCFHNVTVGNSAQLKVNGPVVIKMTGTLNTSGATSLNNTTQIPSNFQILSSYTGSNGVILGNSTSIYALIYSPNTGLNISGAAPLFGTVAAKTLTIGSSGAIHYDTQLKSVWPAVWTLIFGP